MPRLASALLVVGLIVATAAAFAVTERLKLVRSPILATELDRRVFSPVCECESDHVTVGFRLRRSDRLTVTIVAADGRAVARLVRDDLRPAGPVAVRWDGRHDDGSLVPDGTYKPRVHLDDQRRTIELPNPIRVDSAPPRVESLTVSPVAFSPDGDGRRDKVRISYVLGEEGKPLLSVDGEPRVRGRRFGLEGGIDWHGRGLPAGEYRLDLQAVDRAGNVGEPATATVRIRYVELSRRRVEVAAGRRFSVRVRTDATSYSWRLGRATGAGARGVLVVRAPKRPGRYALVVEANDRRARATVVVRAGRGG